VNESRVITSIETAVSCEEEDKMNELSKTPSLRFVISNTTEAGIVLKEDDHIDGLPESFPGKLTKFLYQRFIYFGGDENKGLIILPVELIENNGGKLLDCVLKLSDIWNLPENFKVWIKESNIFCNTLVDRIVTGYAKDEAESICNSLGYQDELLDIGEPFGLWVIEGDERVEKELPFKQAGLPVVFTDNLKPYRERKVRILNGAHTSLVPYALLSGFDTVKSCIDDEKMCAHVRACVFDEIIPTLDLPKDELVAYAEGVIERFANPYIKHYLSSIALNSVSKFKVRVLPSILEYIKRYNKMPNTLIFSFAKLIDFYKTDMTNDDKDVVEFMKTASVKEILANEKLWGEDLSFLEGEVSKYVNK
jgi:tagaturonate reductase